MLDSLFFVASFLYWDINLGYERCDLPYISMSIFSLLAPTQTSFPLEKKRKAKGEYLNEPKTTDLMKKLKSYFKSKVEIPRLKVGNRQSIETLINKEALLLGKFLREERKSWVPRRSLVVSF